MITKGCLGMKKQLKIALLPGDGIGPEVMAEAVKLLKALQDYVPYRFNFEEYPIGGCCLKQFGVPVQEPTLQACRESDVALLGAVGLPEFDANPSHLKPERALLNLRAALGVYCNLRPAKLYDTLIEASPVKPEIVRGIDLMVVRELTGGIYFGKPAGAVRENGQRKAFNTMVYRENEIRRIAAKAFELAAKRRKKVTSVDKANVLDVSQLWRQVVSEVHQSYPEVTLEHMLVDNCAMQLINRPGQFDVILTGNLFGDILSDEASVLTGSIGMLPSASLGDGTPLYEPVHGSAPDIAGKGLANPVAMIASVAMMLHYTLEQPQIAGAIENAIEKVLEIGYHTADLRMSGGTIVSTSRMGELIAEATLQQIKKSTTVLS
jgi:3-isopropylmalate dehydrogenase